MMRLPFQGPIRQTGMGSEQVRRAAYPPKHPLPRAKKLTLPARVCGLELSLQLFHELVVLLPDKRQIGIQRFVGIEHCCVVPVTSFAEPARSWKR